MNDYSVLSCSTANFVIFWKKYVYKAYGNNGNNNSEQGPLVYKGPELLFELQLHVVPYCSASQWCIATAGMYWDLGITVIRLL